MIATRLAAQQSSQTPSPATTPSLRLVDAGEGIARTVTIEAAGRFRLVFEAAMNWGATQWYDLTHDPDAANNLTRSSLWPEANSAEGGIFNQVFYGTEPDDPRLFSRPASSYFPKAPRAFEIVSHSRERVVVEGTCHPIADAMGVLDNVTARIRYEIHPDGLIRIASRLETKRPQAIRQWVCGMVGLCDLTNPEPLVPPDTMGWIRSSATQAPFRWREPPEPFVYAHWNAPQSEHRDWTKASIMMAFLGGDLAPNRHFPHSWRGFKRWGYVRDHVILAPGAVVAQNWAIQLGTRGGALPNLDNAEACRAVLSRVGKR